MSRCKYKRAKQKTYFELQSTVIFWDVRPWLKFTDVSEEPLLLFSGKKISPAAHSLQEVVSVSCLLIYLLDLLFGPEDGGNEFL
jgi:hypothetical protein